MKLSHLIPIFVLCATPLTAQVYLPPGVEIPLVTTTEVSSKTVKKGDKITFQVTADVVYGGHVILAKGATIMGIATEAKKAGRFGNDGKLVIALNPIVTASGTQIPLMTYLGDTAEMAGRPPVQDPKKGRGATGREQEGAVGTAIKGVTGFMDQGEDLVYPANTKFPAFTVAYIPVKVDGVSTVVLGDDPGAPTISLAMPKDSAAVAPAASDSAAAGGSPSKAPATGDSVAKVAVPSDSASVTEFSMAPAEAAFFEATHTWHQAVAAFLAYQGSTPRVRSYGRQVLMEGRQLQKEGRALAKKFNVEVSPVVPDEQTRLNELLKTLMGRPADAARDAQALQYMYQLEEAFLNETEGLDGPTPMGRLIAHASPRWQQYIQWTKDAMEMSSKASSKAQPRR